MNNDKYLPLGSIVRLKGGKVKLIIIGLCPKLLEDNKIYDYISCLYPYGYINSKELFAFNKNQIEEVIFNGYSDEESRDFYDDVEWSVKKNKQSGDEDE